MDESRLGMLPRDHEPELENYYTHEWTVTLPSQTSLKYQHSTPKYFDARLAIDIDPETHAGHQFDKQLKEQIWDEAAIAEFKARKVGQYTDALTKFNALQLLVELDGQIVGYAGFHTLPDGIVNLGMVLKRGARGRGIGKQSWKVLIQLAFNLGVERIEAGTMKDNVAMRALMRSLRFPEIDDIKIIPGRGVVAEVLWDISGRRDVWEKIDLQTDFGESAPLPASKELV